MPIQVVNKLIDAALAYAASENEQEIIEKLLLPFLEALGFGADDFVPQEYLRVIKLGKGKTARDAYKPDHLIKLEGYSIAVIEAKQSSINVLDAWREAYEYATHLNRNEPWTNAIEAIIGFNGREIAIGGKDTRDADVLRLNFSQVLTHTRFLSDVERLISRDALAATATETRLSRGKQDASSPRSLIFRAAQIPHDKLNPIATALQQLLNRYFVELITLGDEDFRAAYCNPVLSGRRREIEDVARDRAPGHTDAQQLTRDTIETEVGEIVRRFHADHVENRGPTQADRFVLILGDPGAGKSTLLDWYRRFSEDHDRICFVRFDGAKGPQEAEPLYEHLLKSVISQSEAFFYKASEPKEQADALRDIMGPRWRKDYDELYSKSIDRDQYFERHFPSLVKEVRLDKAEYLPLIIEALRKKGRSICIILDNLDQTNVVKQVEGFRTLRPFAEQFAVCCLMALREETYRLHENNEPFNAFHRGPVFHVPAPTAVDVIAKRLQLLQSKFADSDHAIGSYWLGNVKMEISRRSAVRCLAAIFEQLRSGDKDLTLIDGVCGHDMRKALDAYKAVCTSSRIGEETSRAVHAKFENFEPSYDAIVRSVICGEWRYYSRESPLVANAFRLVQGVSGSSIFFTLHVLKELNRRAAETHQAGKGFVDLPTLITTLKPRFEVNEANLRRLVFELHSTGVWQVETLKPASYTDFSLVRIQIPGLFLLLSLYKEPAYLDCMAFDTTVEDEETLKTLVERIRSDLDVSEVFRDYLRKIERIEAERAMKKGLHPNEGSKLFFA